MTNKLLAVPVLGTIILALWAGVASAAAPFDPAAETTSLVTDGVSQLGPIMVAVFTGFIAIAVFFFGGRWVLRALRSGRA